MGSPDNYNNVTFEFFNGSQSLVTYNGAYLFGLAGISADGNWNKGGYLNFFTNVGFTNVKMTSTSAAFETDNHAYKAVPDGGMTLMLLGGALFGLETLRRKLRA